jgi:hypothetical protein
MGIYGTVILYLLFASNVILVWDANTEIDLTGYKVYQSLISGTYTTTPITTVPVSPAPTYAVMNLVDGKYYFVVTAYNDTGESGYSNEVSTTIGSNKFDLNSDGNVNVLDLQLLVNAILRTATISGSDINGDGVTNVLDLQLLVNAILGVN